MVKFKTVNAEGKKRCWKFKAPRQIINGWRRKDCPLPESDDKLIKLEIDEKTIELNDDAVFADIFEIFEKEQESGS